MRLVLSLLLALAAAPAWAEWVRVKEYPSEGLVRYYDNATIQKDNNLRKVWLLIDLKARNNNGEMSVRFLLEFDCKEKRGRSLSGTGYTDSMGRGGVLPSPADNKPSAWDDVEPEEPIADLFRIVCAK